MEEDLSSFEADGDPEAEVTYEVEPSDLDELRADIDTVANSGLVENDVLDELRFVTYDSNFLYVFTRGEHQSQEGFTVEEVSSPSATGFRLFKIRHSGVVGRKRYDYGGGKAWLLCDELEKTAVGAKKFPNRNVLDEPDKPQPERILDVVQMAPKAPYTRMDKEGHNYLTALVFHEAAHIEKRRLEDGQIGNPSLDTFPSEEQKTRFMAVVQEAPLLSDAVKAIVIKSISKRAIEEMYAILVEDEATRVHDPMRYTAVKTRRGAKMIAASATTPSPGFIGAFEGRPGEYYTAQVLVDILENRFPDFAERKAFVRSVLDPKQRP